MSNMRVLVTGNHGFIGYILTHDLLKKGYEVVGWDCNYFPENLCFGREDAFKSKENISKQITKDLRDVKKDDLKGIDNIIHLAALPNDPASDINPLATEDINYLATIQLATLAKRAGVKRFIFASSCSVFGVKGNSLINENDAPAPITPYAISKINSENALRPMNSDDFSVTFMRNATCYGVSPRMRFDMVLNNLMGFALTEGKVRMFSDGTSWRPIVHIEDVSRAFISAMEAEKKVIESQTFSVGGENYIVKDIAELVHKVVPNTEIEIAEDAKKDWRSYNVNFNKIESVLGFKLKWTAKKGAEELYDAYKKYGLTKENFQNKEFWAGKTFKHLVSLGKADSMMRLL